MPGREAPYTYENYEKIEIGRGGDDDETPPDLDLSPHHAHLLGVSRRHARINRTPAGYFVEDLNSTNGSWLNENQLVPNRKYILRNGDQLRLGQMLLLVDFSIDRKKRNTFLLVEPKDTREAKLREGLSLDFFTGTVEPYLRAIGTIQHVLDEALSRESIIRLKHIQMRNEQRSVEITVEGATEAVKFVHNTLMPFRKKTEGGKREDLVKQLFKEVAPTVTDEKQSAVTKTLLEPINTILDNELELTIQHLVNR